jgi:hypothetical protein
MRSVAIFRFLFALSAFAQEVLPFPPYVSQFQYQANHAPQPST